MELLKRLLGLLRRRDALVRGQPPRSRPAENTARPDLGDLPQATDAERIVRQICREAIASADGWQVKLADSVRWKALKDEAAELQIAVMMAALDPRPRGSISYAGNAWQIEQLRKSMVSQIVRRDLPFTAGQLGKLLNAWKLQAYSLEYGLPGRAILGAVERHVDGAPPSPALASTLDHLRRRALQRGYGPQAPTKFAQGVADRIARLLEPDGTAEPALPSGPFAEALTARLSAQPEHARGPLLILARLAANAGDKAKPNGKWLTTAAELVDKLDRQRLSALVSDLLDDTTPNPARPDNSLDILKGLIWSSTLLESGELAGQVGRFAEKCFRKVPSVGARSVKLGNAALWALSEMAGEPRAAAELFRLREKIKYPSARRVIASRLDDLAAKVGESVEALEDVSLPDFGLGEDGCTTMHFGPASAQLELQATGLEIRWSNGAGAPVKSVPTAVRGEYASDFAGFRQAVKDIEAARAAQVLRLEQSWVEERSWSFAEWSEHFLRHPLRRPIVEALIWRVHTAGGPHSFTPIEGVPRDIDGHAPDLPANGRVTLWHPLDSEPGQVLAWRQRILDLGISQPIKQAHREIYVLTDAERRTETYSNRFAAHILRQHQFRALCQARGWKYDLMGGWDAWSVPTRLLPKQGLKVEYQVEVVDDGQRSAAWVSLHLASDQVRFIDARNRRVELEEIPPTVFSEVLRDVDLFVAVTSVANDPGWTDGGPNGRHGAYWREWAFGELGQGATTRRELVDCPETCDRRKARSD